MAALLLGAFASGRHRAKKNRRSKCPCSTSWCRCREHRRKRSNSAYPFRWRNCCARSRESSTCIRSPIPGMSIVIVRFYVGTDEEDAIVKTYNKLYSNFDRIPPGVSQPLIKVRSIDDVPILALTLWGPNYDAYRLRRIAGRAGQHAEAGGRRLRDHDHRRPAPPGAGRPGYAETGSLRTEPGRHRGNVSRAPTAARHAGSFARDNREFQVEAGRFLTELGDLRQVVVGVQAGRPVYLKDVAEELEDGPAEPDNYVLSVVCRPRSGERRSACESSARLSGSHHHLRQAQRHQCHPSSPIRCCKVNSLRGYAAAQRPARHGYAQLRRNRQGQVQRTARASAAWRPYRLPC